MSQSHINTHTVAAQVSRASAHLFAGVISFSKNVSLGNQLKGLKLPNCQNSDAQIVVFGPKKKQLENDEKTLMVKMKRILDICMFV